MKLSRLLLFVIGMAMCMPTWAANDRKAKPVVSILGDSYSTFEDFIPAGNDIWYFQKCDTMRTDVDNVRQTWWWQLIDEGGFVLGKNDSYSGATISYKGYRRQNYKDRSFITRLPRVGSCDILLIFGATNDIWARVPLGEYEYSKWDDETLLTFRPALALLLDRAQQYYPGTEIYFVVNDVFSDEYLESIQTICDHYGVPTIRLHDIQKKRSHPDRKGMIQIKDQILQYLNAEKK